MVTESKFAKIERINGHKIIKERGGRSGSVMKDKTKYSRTPKHKGLKEW